MKMKRPIRSKKKLFDPDEVVTRLRSALERDKCSLSQMYETASPHRSDEFSGWIDVFLKKYQSLDTDVQRLTRECYDGFRATNNRMGEVNRTTVFPNPSERVNRRMPFMDQVHLRARAIARSLLGTFEEDEWFLECRNSSGASIGVPFWDTSVTRKLTLPLSSTERAVPLFQRYLSFDFQLKSALAEQSSLSMFDVVQGSRATTVDKDSRKRRFIAVEPTVNMYLQQGLMAMFYNRFDRAGLELSSLPPEHTRRAFWSSITCREATIDWSSASDSVSQALARWILPPAWAWAVDITRSPRTLLEGSWIDLEMFATMGNAVTFPLETLVFWAYGQAVDLTLKDTNAQTNWLLNDPIQVKRISVFGDDCIVPSSLAPMYIKVLGELGFTVNEEKSFFDSVKFRESCGGDYRNGFDVRPYFVRSPGSRNISSLEPWLYTIINGLQQKYISYFGPLKYVYASALWEEISSLFLRYDLRMKIVPSYFPDDSGVKDVDILRVCSIYRIRLNPVVFSRHGSAIFNYCRFIYKNKAPRSDSIVYATWLKNPLFEKKLTPFRRKRVYNTKRVGGYVVAKGISCHWYELGGFQAAGQPF